MSVKKQKFKATISMCDKHPLSLREQVLPIIKLLVSKWTQREVTLQACLSERFKLHYLQKISDDLNYFGQKSVQNCYRDSVTRILG